MIADVLVVGGGPAGRALARETGHRGLRTLLLDRAPGAPWRQTYGSWVGELPAGLPDRVLAARARGRAIATAEHRLGWTYAVLDTAALREHLDAGLAAAAVEVRAGRAVGAAGPGALALAGGGELRARLIVDAGGARQPLAGRTRRPGRGRVEQSAYGVVVDAAAAAGLVAPGEALFMDWRPGHGEPGPATFLYGVPLGGGAVLLEETSLAARPGLPMPLLRRRLATRLAGHGIDPAGAATERVRFPLDTPRHRTPGVLGFGAAAPLVHPATGFSVATALALAPGVAQALANGLPAGPDRALAAAEAVLWPPAARAVHRFRRTGLEALLRMPPRRLPEFFELFFSLPERHRWSYLTGRGDLPGALATMGALFARAGWSMRGSLVLPALLPPTGRAVRPGSRGRAAVRAPPR